MTIMAEFDGEIISIDLGIQINNCTFVLANLNRQWTKILSSKKSTTIQLEVVSLLSPSEMFICHLP